MSQEKSAEPRELLVPATLSGHRLDVALSRLLTPLSRRDAQRLCEEGQVLLRGKRAKKSDLVQEGDPLCVTPLPTRVATPAPGSLVVRLTTEHWVVIAKPALQPTAPRDDTEFDTVANALVAAFPETATLGHRPLEPGLLHRLDNGTSGLLVAARTQEAFERGTLALKQSRWQKRYQAVVTSGRLPERGRLIGKLAPFPGQPQRVRIEGKFALSELPSGPLERLPLEPFETRFELEQERAGLSLLRVLVGPAFRHQIRAHFEAAGAPLVNDVTYGAMAHPRLAAGRHALHAARVAWEGEPRLPGFDVTEPLAADLSGLFGRDDG